MAETEKRQFLSFTMDGVDYAVGILQVREILQYEPVTRVPSVPRSVRGVINLRGAVVPVVDLSLKFGLPETPVSGRTCILIVEARLDGEPTVLGVLADSVSEVLELGPRDVEPPPAFGTRVTVDYLAGMGKVDGRFVLLLDLDRALSTDEKDLAARLTDETLPANRPSREPGAPEEPRSAP
ncbi:MAG TPA: chemotaxis protein CheW [Anaeromyxobacteraceae bacterium]|nr:chemotaxis protein CheW [Anaeromyxobacteraceae bacterium]